jgi:uncharacterized membrane protein
MDALQERMELLGRSLALLATWAIVGGAVSVALALGDLADGEVVAICRTVLGVIGVAAGLLVWTLRRAGIDGWQAVMLWTAAQVPFIAWSTEGNATRQVIEMLLGFSASTTVNGVVTSSEQYGINAVGIVLVIWASRTRERWDRKLKPLLDQPVAAAARAA